ncbi:2-C-methyl-D-erythritol 4-phosphate cytidylyltransferase [Anaerococcus hydrogenalis]|uniref:2-C-methyl-D-erythritol 4-phosphate cytidylyltransferase n=1 Tax=Anaerococcus hydrogenalis TaxID=33029 RepID=A0A2N6UHV8_9FIRM|nr:2-C-methyl-D-erythritol 4-phosphate cytidylyltransferase [Anaerococcus hydrogenalis]MDK7695347.1 2-C-methyl-D-erythritol 4-phosphate cytidylyltransferase [Anaerococcus hydrogenalis]MDK7697106.1 2-C-methyl-D-erythritol 4-phosphate cytidylyltransferase [Anaerococcus hydrogenalis]MDK7708373.1 2-C-methyl-D-erythritol 4-phosphate cytidylyltransferase [Anaerococcus hydrogenalis]PMC81197.1 2-C-methyl-D-erythritol 4-phosphate cytidylyltransferase [Anaerococcus hydrogenalis]
MIDDKKISAVITAAGNGLRMKSDKAKPYIELKGRKILEICLDTVVSLEEIDQIIVVIRKDDEDYLKDIIKKYKKKISYVFGKETRELSTYEGLKAVDKDSKLVLTHDGVRPFASKKLFKNIMDELREYKAVISAVKSKDTVKIVGEDLLVKNTPLRKEVYNVQTPQAFDKEMILSYYEKYIKSDLTITDDSQLFEIFSKEKIKVVEGEYSNIKITTPEDLIFARGFLED